MDELHRKVLEALGFELVTNAVGTVWLEDRNGFMFKNGERCSSPSASANRTEADAWAQAPTLEALMSKLVEVITRSDAKPEIRLFVNDAGWYCYIVDGNDIPFDFDSDAVSTMAHAIASVFVQMCEAKLIDGKAVVL